VAKLDEKAIASINGLMADGNSGYVLQRRIVLTKGEIPDGINGVEVIREDCWGARDNNDKLIRKFDIKRINEWIAKTVGFSL
jgi:hypothetical protein